MTEPLTFKRAGAWYMRSTCGNYNVSKAMLGETAKYSAWWLSEKKYLPNQLLGTEDTAEAAQAICQEHANQQQGPKK